MQIISNFNDYYDPMLQYGTDKNITFNRINKTNFKPTKPQDWQLNHDGNEVLSEKTQKILELSLPQQDDFSENDQYILKAYNKNKFKLSGIWIPFKVEVVHAVINAKVFTSYMLLENIDLKTPGASSFQERYKIIKRNASSKELFDHIKQHSESFDFTQIYIQGVEDIKNTSSYEEFSQKKYKSYYHETVNSMTEADLINMHKEFSTPVFFIHFQNVYKNLPLSYFGLTNIFDNNMEKTFQEISYCQANIIQNKNEPPVETSNLDKVQQHGFDKKISFRHRK